MQSFDFGQLVKNRCTECNAVFDPNNPCWVWTGGYMGFWKHMCDCKVDEEFEE